MEVKFTKEQEELLLKNYEKACTRADRLTATDKAIMKVFLLECLGQMLSHEVIYRIHDEMIADIIKASLEVVLK